MPATRQLQPDHVVVTTFPATITATLDEFTEAAHRHFDDGLATWVVNRESGDTYDLRQHVTSVTMTVADTNCTTTHQLYGADTNPGTPSTDETTSYDDNTIAAAYHQSPLRLSADDGRDGRADNADDGSYHNELLLWSQPFASHGPDTHIAGDADNELVWVPTAATPPGEPHDPTAVVAHTALCFIGHEHLEACWVGHTHYDDTVGEHYANHLIAPHNFDTSHGIAEGATVSFQATINGHHVTFQPQFD